MWFKNIIFFRFIKPFTLTPEELHEQLAQKSFRHCSPMEMDSCGWVSPLGKKNEFLVHAANQCIIFTARKEEKILPASVVRDFINEQIEEIETQQMRKVRKREKDMIRTQVLQELLPRAFTRAKDTFAYIDVKNGWLLVDTSSRKRAEELTEFLRESIGSLPISSPHLKKVPVQVMTHWLTKKNCPTEFELAKACEMTEMNEEGAVVNCKRQDLLAKEIQAHLHAGKLVKRIALEWQKRLGFIIDDELVIKRLEFLDFIQESPSEEEAQNQTKEERFDADFFLMTGELATLLSHLIELFGGEDEAAYDQMR